VPTIGKTATVGETATVTLPVVSDPASLQVFHYFSDDLGKKTIDEIIGAFQQAHPDIALANSPMDHETFKVGIPMLLKSGSPPDIFSYWAGARVQSVVDEGFLQPLDELWAEQRLDEVFPASVAAGSLYNGKRYFLPIGYHYVAFFYNPKLFETMGVSVPKNWDDLKQVAARFKQAGIPAFALGSRERWPAQFWFDYLLLRTAGAEYRQELMAGKRAYTDAEVVRVMEMWKELVEAGYFYPEANAYTWSEAAELVARGQAAMTLMGTWVTGYYKNSLNLVAEQNYNYFPFPVVDEGVPFIAVGPIDGFVMARDARHPVEAQTFLAFLASAEVQRIWTVGQGALPPNIQVDPANYDPLMQRVLSDVAASEKIAFNYDLATTPAMAEVGLDAFTVFMERPSDYLTILQSVEQNRQSIFKETTQ
jgi:multiple sugar transport system substrate-binding protein